MSGSRAIVRTFEVAGFTAEVTLPSLHPGAIASAVVEWSPRVPRPDVDFTASERARYQQLLMEAVDHAC